MVDRAGFLIRRKFSTITQKCILKTFLPFIPTMGIRVAFFREISKKKKKKTFCDKFF